MEELDEDATEQTEGAYFGEIKRLKDPWTNNFRVSSQEPFEIEGCDRRTGHDEPVERRGDLETDNHGIISELKFLLFDLSSSALWCDDVPKIFEPSYWDFVFQRPLIKKIDIPSEREILDAVVGEITPQSLRTFIHAQRFSVSQTVQFFQDLLSGFPHFTVTSLFAVLRYCIDEAFNQIRLEKLFAHFLSSLVVVVFLFEYLVGYVQRGGWATYSDTSWEFRATYVSIELRLAAYFWFKFRAWPAQPSSADRGRKRSRAAKGEPSVSCRDERNKFEPRLKERKRTVWLGEYDTYEEAANVFWVGAFYCMKDRKKRFNDDVLSRCEKNLPHVPTNLSGLEKATWVREQAEKYRNGIPHSSSVPVENQGVVENPGEAAAEIQGGGQVVSMISGAAEGGSQILKDASCPAPCGEVIIPFNSSPPTFMIGNSSGLSMNISTLDDIADSDLMRPPILEGDRTLADHLTKRGPGQEFGDLYVDEYLEEGDSRQGEVSGPGVGSEGLNSPRTCGDQGAHHRQDVYHLRQSHAGNAIVSECGGDEPDVGAIERPEETEEHPTLRASTNHMLAVDPPIVDQHIAQVIEFTDTIQSALQELHERGWNWKILPRVSTTFSVAFSRLEGQDRPELNATNYSAFQELHKQGWKITLEPVGSASSQDGNRRPQSDSASENLCRSCMKCM